MNTQASAILQLIESSSPETKEQIISTLQGNQTTTKPKKKRRPKEELRPEHRTVQSCKEYLIKTLNIEVVHQGASLPNTRLKVVP